MNLLNINAKDLNILGIKAEKSTIDYSFLVEEGDILEGVVLDNDKVKLSINGKDINIDNSKTNPGQSGDVKKYQVLNSSTEKLVLKELKENTGVNEKIDINSKINSASVNQDYFSKEIQKSLSEAKTAVADNDMKEQLTDKLDKSIIVMSPEDIRAIEEEGKSIEEMDIEEIHKKITKINREKLQNQNTNCGIVDKNVDNLSSWQNTGAFSANSVDNSTINTNVVKEKKYQCGVLIENTDFVKKFQDKIKIDFINENGEIVENQTQDTLEMVDKLFENIENKEDGFVSKDAIKYLIGNNLEPTLENIYKAKYAGKNIVTHNISDEDFEQLKAQVEEVIINSGYEITEENVDIAKWLIENDIPITEETFEKYHVLNELNKLDIHDVNKIVSDYMDDEIPTNEMYINYVDFNVIEETVNNIDTITDEAIEEVIKAEKVINLNELLVAQKEIDNNVNEIKKNDYKKSFGLFEGKGNKAKYLNLDRIMTNLDEMEAQRSVDIQTVTAKRQLEEIRLKLTVESGRKLALKGFDIATEALEQVVEELKQLESKYNDNYPLELKDNYEGQKLYLETNNKVADIKEMSGYVIATTYSVRDKITLQGIYEEGQKEDYVAYSDVEFKISRHNVDKFNETFETIMTMPRKDMGDTIQKAFRNVTEVLEDLGLETNELNHRAVRILGYNSMDINIDNIEEVKLYDYKVNNAIDKLKPATVVELIRQGKNPLNMTIDELNYELDLLNDNISNVSDDDYSKYLWRLDKMSDVTPEEREAYIGIYRLIHQVQSSDGAVIGAIVNAGQEITLNSLLTASRTKKSKGIDINVDDKVGAITSVKRNGKMIDDQIKSAFKDIKIDLSKRLVKEVSETITPEIINWAKSENIDILNMSMEKLIGFIKEKDEINEKIDKEYYIDKLNDIKDIADNSNEVVKMLTGIGMETSISNILAASDVLDGNGLGGTVKKLYKKNEKDSKIKLEKTNENISMMKDKLIESALGIVEHLDDKNELADDYEDINNTVQDIVNAYKNHYGSSDISIENLREISRNMSFVTNMSKKECYDIPLVISQGEDGIKVTNINLTVIRNTEKKQVAINVSSESLGNVEAKFEYKNGVIKGLILGDNTEGIDALKNNYQNLKDKALEEDINIKQLDYGINNKVNYTFTTSNNQVDETEVTTKKLYSLSKAMIMNIKETEEKLLA